MNDDQQKPNMKRQPSTQSEEADQQCQRAAKRLRKAASDDLICAITRELPFEPVTAEDGRLYERAAIEQHISNCQKEGHALKSPITNEPMGQVLFDMPQIKSLIETLIENHSITGDLADSWEKKKNAEDLLKKARGGDAFSMYKLHVSYRDGNNFFKKDENLAFQWVKKAHAAGSVYATAALGSILLLGTVGDCFAVSKNISHGLILTTRAAEKGSDFAAFNLGFAYANGKYGVPVDIEEAIAWLQKVLSSDDCPFRHLSPWSRQECRRKLKHLIEKQGSDEKKCELC